MRYELFSTADPQTPLAVSYLEDAFTAERWGREWVLAHKDMGSDFILRDSAGTFSASVLRTVAGQAYIMRKPIVA